MEKEEKNEKLHNIDNIEDKLNSPKTVIEKIRIHKIDDKSNLEIKNNWQDIPLPEEDREGKKSFGLKFFIFSLIIFLIASLYVGYLFATSKNTTSNKNINITNDIKPYVDGGEVSTVNIDIENKNQVTLKNAILSISYNRGISAGSETSKINEKKELGDLTSGAVSKQSFEVQFYGQEGDVKDLTINLEYSLDGSNGSFNKTIKATTIIQKSPIEIKIDGPTSVNSGQNVNYNLTIQNNLQNPMGPFLVQVSLPQAFKIKNNLDNVVYFSVDKLDVGESLNKTISGYFDGQSGDTNTIHIDAGLSSDNNSKNISVVFFSSLFDVKTEDSPLKLSLSAVTDRGNANILKFGDKLTFVVNYANNSDETLTNVEIVAKIDGDAPVLSGISILDDGYYDFTNKTITWNGATRSDLKSLPPQGNGFMRFEVPVVTSGANTPKLTVEIDGKALNASSSEIISNVNKDYLVQGSATLSAYTSYKTSPFPNTGPVPPVVDTDTTYTLHLTASAQNNLDDAQVSFILPIYSNWLNTVSDANNIIYNKSNRNVVWNIGHISAGGISRADIMVNVRPSLSHLGKSPEITSGIIFTGTETDSKARISVNIRPLTTTLTNENWGIDTGSVIAKPQ